MNYQECDEFPIHSMMLLICKLIQGSKSLIHFLVNLRINKLVQKCFIIQFPGCTTLEIFAIQFSFFTTSYCPFFHH